MPHPKAAGLIAIVLLSYCVSECTAQQRSDKDPAFTLSMRIVNYDVSGNVLTADSATRYQSSHGDWRYAFSFGNNSLETIYLRGHGVYLGDSFSGRLIKVWDSAAGCPSVTADELRRDPKFVGTESVLGFTAYILRERIMTYVVETYFVPALKRIPFKRTHVFADGHKLVEEPISITMGEPTQTDLAGPDYERIEQIPIFNHKLSQLLTSQPKPSYPATVSTPVNILVEVIVDQTGRVVSARSITPVPLFAEAAVYAAYQASFSPTTIDGKVVVARGNLNYTFRPPKKIPN